MKFKFGKYPTVLITSVYDNYMWKKYGSECDDVKRTFIDIIVFVFDATLQRVYDVLNKIYFNHVKHKISVKVEPHDTYSADFMLAHIILPVLKQLKDKKHGSPFVDDSDVPENIRSTADTSERAEYDIDKFHHARWDFVINEMIFAFNTKAGDNTEWDDKFSSGEADFLFEKMEGTDYSVLTEGPNHTYEIDYEGRNKYAAQIDNGFRLFGKYYGSLWS